MERVMVSAVQTACSNARQCAAGIMALPAAEATGAPISARQHAGLHRCQVA